MTDILGGDEHGVLGPWTVTPREGILGGDEYGALPGPWTVTLWEGILGGDEPWTVTLWEGASLAVKSLERCQGLGRSRSGRASGGEELGPSCSGRGAQGRCARPHRTTPAGR
jgi:hypothetical protein